VRRKISKSPIRQTREDKNDKNDKQVRSGQVLKPSDKQANNDWYTVSRTIIKKRWLRAKDKESKDNVKNVVVWHARIWKIERGLSRMIPR